MIPYIYMFYWEAGYGKFLNMGKTAVYQNYIHFFLTIPNDPQNIPGTNDTVKLRCCLPEVLSMGVGSSALESLKMLSNENEGYDKRKYLQGFVTTFQSASKLGKKHGLINNNYSETLRKNVDYVYDFEATDDDWNNKVIVMSGRLYWAKKWGPHCDPLNHGKVFSASKNTWFKEDIMSEPPGLENAQGLLNPQEGIEEWMKNYIVTEDYNSVPENFNGDANLCAIASQCIQCYYPPNLLIKNPHHRKSVGMNLDDACLLWQAMYIYGDTGGDEYGYSERTASCKQLGAAECLSFPYGSYYFSAAIGSCIYAVTAALGWNSSQMSLMSTGGGNEKFCTYPGYDYEIVYIGNRNVMTKGEDPYSFKLLDITGGGNKNYLDFYIKYGFVQGSTTNGDSNLTKDITTRLKQDEDIYNVVPFNACMMPLNEINVDPSIWKDYKPNMLFYDKPEGECDWKSNNYNECIKTGYPDGWVYSENNKIISCRDCPYEDAKNAIRDKAKETNCNKKFVPSWMLKDNFI